MIFIEKMVFAALSLLVVAYSTATGAYGQNRKDFACSTNTECTHQDMNKFMKIAIDEAYEGIRNGDGGPFGAVVVKDGILIASGHNRVLSNNDPSCHGEIDAIRKACTALNTFDLSGCELYTTGEPCHMCLCACMWANISKIYYGCTIEDNGLIGFRDDKFDKIFGGRDKLDDYMTELDREACIALFKDYAGMNHKNY